MWAVLLASFLALIPITNPVGAIAAFAMGLLIAAIGVEITLHGVTAFFGKL
jgi:small neutral amino acid transporter SnatA (MarC family)